MEKNDPIEWGLQRDITPRVGSRLVQEGNQLHYLVNRTGVTGIFNEAGSRKLNAAFPHFVEQMKLMLFSGGTKPPLCALCHPCTMMDLPVKPTCLALMVTSTSSFTPLNADRL